MPPGCVIGGVPCGAVSAGKAQHFLGTAYANPLCRHAAQLAYCLLGQLRGVVTVSSRNPITPSLHKSPHWLAIAAAMPENVRLAILALSSFLVPLVMCDHFAILAPFALT